MLLFTYDEKLHNKTLREEGREEGREEERIKNAKKIADEFNISYEEALTILEEKK